MLSFTLSVCFNLVLINICNVISRLLPPHVAKPSTFYAQLINPSRCICGASTCNVSHSFCLAKHEDYAGACGQPLCKDSKKTQDFTNCLEINAVCDCVKCKGGHWSQKCHPCGDAGVSVFIDILKLILALYIVFATLYVSIRPDKAMLPKDALGRPIYPKKPTREQVAAAKAARPWDPERDKRELRAKNRAPWGEFGLFFHRCIVLLLFGFHASVWLRINLTNSHRSN